MCFIDGDDAGERAFVAELAHHVGVVAEQPVLLQLGGEMLDHLAATQRDAFVARKDHGKRALGL
jgi:hypothetical protein